MSLSNDSINKKDFLKNKKMLLATWGCGDKDSLQCRDFIPLFEKMFGKLIILPSRNYYYFYGKKELNAKFLETIKKEKPDYLLFCNRYNEVEIDTLKRIKEISPKTKTILENGDDDLRFDDWGRYYALFFDYIITTKKEIEIYKKENLNGAFFLLGISPDFYKPLNLEKKYDVTFIGRPYIDRYNYIKFLKEQGVNIKVFGGEWSKHPDLKDIWGGVLFDEDLVKVINQSKININFSKTLDGKQGALKGRILESPACGSFLLNEYTSMNLKFINNKKEINFRNRKELLEKIDYYLKHEKEREKIAKQMQEYVIKHHSWESLFFEFFKKIDQDKLKLLKLPEINKKISKISYKELDKSLTEIKKILKDVDYVFFDEYDSSLSNREYLQAYSLSISKKQISCCDYYVNSRLLGDYLAFKSKNTFNTQGNEFYQFLNINQLMITKEYFLKNLYFFKQLYYGKINPTQQGIIKDEDIVFISIPLIRIKNFPKVKYEQIKENFYTLFFDKLFSLIYQKKFFNPYIFKFLLFSLMGNFYMIKYLLYRFSFNFNRNILRTFSLVK